MPERPPVGESQSTGTVERTVGLMAGQARTLEAALEHRVGVKVPLDARILCWLVEFAAFLMNRCEIGSDGKTLLHRLHGRIDKPTDSGMWREDLVHACQTSKRWNVGPEIRWNADLVVRSSGCHRGRVGDQNTCGERQDTSRV